MVKINVSEVDNGYIITLVDSYHVMTNKYIKDLGAVFTELNEWYNTHKTLEKTEEELGRQY